LDGDGVAESLAGAPLSSAVLGEAGAVVAFSGATGAQLFRIDGLNALEHLGSSLAVVDDVDGDGVRDFAFGTPGYNAGAGSEGRVEVYSTATLAPLFTVN